MSLPVEARTAALERLVNGDYGWHPVVLAVANGNATFERSFLDASVDQLRDQFASIFSLRSVFLGRSCSLICTVSLSTYLYKAFLWVFVIPTIVAFGLWIASYCAEFPLSEAVLTVMSIVLMDVPLLVLLTAGPLLFVVYLIFFGFTDWVWRLRLKKRVRAEAIALDRIMEKYHVCADEEQAKDHSKKNKVVT